jgi:hypothetical protein
MPKNKAKKKKPTSNRSYVRCECYKFGCGTIPGGSLVSRRTRGRHSEADFAVGEAILAEEVLIIAIVVPMAEDNGGRAAVRV